MTHVVSAPTGSVTIEFRDPGLPTKTVEITSEEEFFPTVLREGGCHTDALCPALRRFAWRPLGGGWIDEGFMDAIRRACRAQGVTFGTTEYNIRQLRDLVDYDGLTVEEVAVRIGHDRINR